MEHLERESASHGLPGSPPAIPATAHPYGSVFWLCYAANTSLMVAISILFRYADFVIGYLGGTERDLGLIVGVGMVGALAIRVLQGVGIDRYGARWVWLLCLMLFILSSLAHLWIDTAHGIGIYLARIVFTSSVAGCFGASLTYISLRVPRERVAEMIGTMGTSGFVGLAIGPTLGDWLIRGQQVTQMDVGRMFMVAAGMAAVSLLCAALATRGEPRRAVPARRVPLWGVLRKYQPGPILLVAAAMGLGVGLPHVFLKPYVEQLSIPRIATFFWIYALTAFTVRIATRRITERLGFRRVILLGMACLVASMLAYIPVQSEWHLAFPAMLAGLAHAFLFPAVVGGGSVEFPSRYRGVATTLMLAMFDVGNLVGQPLVGGLIYYSRQLGLPSYPVMFLSMAALLSGITLFYALSSPRAARRFGVARGEPAEERPVPAETGLPLHPVTSAHQHPAHPKTSLQSAVDRQPATPQQAAARDRA